MTTTWRGTFDVDHLHALPAIEATRVRLRAFRADDVQALFAIYSDARVMRWWSHAALRTLDDAAWLLRDIEAGRANGTHYQWAITLRGNDRVIGTTTLFAFDSARRSATLAYALAFGHRGNGLAREAVRGVLDHAFGDLALQRIEADVDARNAASIRLVRALGFQQSDTPGAPASADRGLQSGIHFVLERASCACGNSLS